MSIDIESNDVEIRIELPLPLDISATLIQIIGLTYPGAVMKNGQGDHRWRSESRLVIGIPESERHHSPKSAERYRKKRKKLNADADGLLTEMRTSGASFGLPEHLARVLLAMGKSWVNENEGENYVEATIYDKETHKRWVFYIARSEQQTPHEIRQKIEKERDDLKAEVERLHALLEGREIRG